MDNIFKVLRKERGLTQEQLAKKCRVTRLAIIRNEQGLFTSPLPAVAHFFNGGRQVEEAYRHYQFSKRREADVTNAVKRAVTLDRISKLPAQPFLLWRNEILGPISQMKFCQMLCLHPATVANYERNNQRFMPMQIKLALLDAGLTGSRLENLETAGAEYYAYKRTGQNGTHTYTI